jgi:hypothetical protein
MANDASGLGPGEEGQMEGRSRHKETSLEKGHVDVSNMLDDAGPNPETYAAIMATHKPDPRGPGYIKLYLLAGVIFLCSTMSGTVRRSSFSQSEHLTKY